MNRLVTRAALLDELFRGATPAYVVKPLRTESLPTQIRIDLTENTHSYTLRADLPGIARDDIHVHVEGNTVSLRAQVRSQALAEGEKSLRTERHTGPLEREVQLPQELDDSSARARYDDGVLVLMLPKKVASPGHKLTIE